MTPFGVTSGYVMVAMAYLATKSSKSGAAGALGVEDGAMLVAVSLLPQTWKFLWAPVVDLTLTRKWWYVLSAVLCAAGMVAMAAFPLDKPHLFQVEAAVFLTSFVSTFLGMAVEALIAHSTPVEQRGRIGGWLQAGNLGGNGLGGGAGLWMAVNLPAPEHPASWISGAVLGGLFIAGCLALLFVHELTELAPAATLETPILERILLPTRALVRDIWKIVVSRTGFVCALLCVLPIGTGAATNVLSEAEIAGAWHVDAETVASYNGVMNGIVSVFGCLLGGEICARMSSRKAYVIFGLLMAGVAAVMALSPYQPWSYKTFILGYAFVTGLSYAAYTGFVLEAIGKGAAATKYNAFASLANMPLMYMTIVLAKAFAHYKAGGPEKQASAMLLTEAGGGVVGVVVLVVAVMTVNRLFRPIPAGACQQCGYDMQGLPEGSTCPECGKAASAA
jgi:MFS family permease